MTEQQKAEMFDRLQQTRVIVVRKGRIDQGDTKSIDVPDWVISLDAEKYAQRQKH
jgi:hypothetical protein